MILEGVSQEQIRAWFGALVIVGLAAGTGFALFVAFLALRAPAPPRHKSHSSEAEP